MNEEFTGSKSSFANDKIILGIHEKDVQLAENNAGNSVAFVTGGDLFVYKAEGAHIAKVFSFTDDDHDDVKELVLVKEPARILETIRQNKLLSMLLFT